MFQVGDLIVYGGTGVCRVREITRPSFSGVNPESLYYVLQPLYQECVVYTPVDNTRVLMRPILTREEAEALIDCIPSIHAQAFHSPVLRQLEEHYAAVLRSYECADLVELTMSIYAKKQDAESKKRKIGGVDERYMKRGEELLFGELGAALEMEPQAVPDYIARRVRAAGEEA